jgi:hypothetical protein
LIYKEAATIRMAEARAIRIIGRMEKGDGENVGDDGIVAEDVTQLVEHITLTGAHELPADHEWELASPAADLEDAPILIGELPDPEPAQASADIGDDPEFFTETQADITQLLPPGERPGDDGSPFAAERARWQKRVDDLAEALAVRERQLAERERRIDELMAQLAALAPAGVSASTEAAEDADYTQDLPATERPPALPAAAPRVAPRLRRYLIGLDLVGCVHEVDGRRISIGRTRDNDLRIVDPTVSRLHAMLSVRDGEAMLIDANSRNGIFVNGIQLRYAKLEDGDLVTFGSVRFRYRVGGDSEGGVAGSA